MFTVTNASDLIQLYLGGQPSLLTSVLQIVNLAGQHMVGMRRWKYLEGVEVFVGTVAGQEYLSLPANFSEAVSMVSANDGIRVVWTTRDRINEYRSSSVASADASCFYVALSTLASSTNTPPTPRLETWPTPASTNASRFRLVYRAGWADLSTDSQYVPIPEWSRALFMELLEAFAKGMHRAEQGSLGDRLSAVQASPTYQAAIREDESKQTNYGMITGAIPYTGDERYYRRFWRATGP